MNEDGKPLNFYTWRGKKTGKVIKSGERTPHGVWYRALRATGMRPRGPYTMRHTFTSIALSNGANTKWIAEYAGTSITMIERHYGKYVRNDVDDQLARIMGSKSETFSETSDDQEDNASEWISENSSDGTALV